MILVLEMNAQENQIKVKKIGKNEIQETKKREFFKGKYFLRVICFGNIKIGKSKSGNVN